MVAFSRIGSANMEREGDGMSRLIDADKMCDDLATVDQQYGTMIDWAIRVTKAQPTVDTVPVVHGHWRRGKSYPHNIYCSNCFRTYVPNEEMELWKDQTLPRKYCPECGASMDEVTES